MSRPETTLEDLCGGSLPASLARLGAEDRQRLLDTIVSSRKRQAQQLREATESGLQLLPRLMRGPVKKAIGG